MCLRFCRDNNVQNSWLPAVKQAELDLTNQPVLRRDCSEFGAVTSSTWGTWSEGWITFLPLPECQGIPDCQTLCSLKLHNSPAETVWGLKVDLGFKYPHSCHSPQAHHVVKWSLLRVCNKCHDSSKTWGKLGDNLTHTLYNMWTELQMYSRSWEGCSTVAATVTVLEVL